MRPAGLGGSLGHQGGLALDTGGSVLVDNFAFRADEFCGRCPVLLRFGDVRRRKFFFKLGSASDGRLTFFLRRGLTSERGSALYARASEFIGNFTVGTVQGPLYFFAV